MRIHALIHASFEGLGYINEWADRNQHIISTSNSSLNEKLPSVDDYDLLIVMGGPQSACNLDKHPYLKREIDLINQTLETSKPLLGICLGAQLIGTALGAPAKQSPQKEIGVFPVELTSAGEDDPIFSQFPNSFMAMHWHNDMPGIAEGCTLLAKSKGCPHQAFRFGKRVYGLQFHLEFTHFSTQEILAHAASDLTPGSPYVQTAETILQTDLGSINKRMQIVLDKLVTL